MRLIVQGGQTLKGHYQPSGNSNEAIALIAAALLSEDPITLHNVPQTAVVQAMCEMATEIGTNITRQDKQLTLHTPTLAARHIESDYLQRSVASILFLAPILARRQHASLEWSDAFGRLHTHLTAMRDLGFKVDIQGNLINFTATQWQEQEIILNESSVTATSLVSLLAAAFGNETTIYNAASEPHVRALLHMLVAMGAEVDGIGSNLLRIRRCKSFRSGEYTIQPDHIEIASVAAIAAITPGHVIIGGVQPKDLRIINRIFERLGVRVFYEDDKLHIHDQGSLIISKRQEDVDVAVDTAPWPGFPSDLVAITTVLATQANGTTLMHEKLFNNRLLFVDKLKAMGAQIVLCDPHRAIVVGPTPLRAEYIDNPDVRIGLALLGAALCSEGQVIIDRGELMERNFEDVLSKLNKLGAQIEVDAS